MFLPLFNCILAAFPEQLFAIGTLFTVKCLTGIKVQHQQKEEGNQQF
jgi:hypothetical protein